MRKCGALEESEPMLGPREVRDVHLAARPLMAVHEREVAGEHQELLGEVHCHGLTGYTLVAGDNNCTVNG